MASDSFIGPLLRVPLFQGLSQPQLAIIARRAERVMFRIGQTMIKAGQPGDGAYVLIVGTAERRDGGAAETGTAETGTAETGIVETGSLVGEMSMLIETDYSTTVIAKSAVRALKITRAALHAQMEADPELAAHFVAKIAARLHDFTDELRRIERGIGSGQTAGPAEVQMQTGRDDAHAGPIANAA
jgi:CRP-like cAMP-binding protein